MDTLQILNRIKKIEDELEAIRNDLMQLTTMLFTLMPDTDDSFDLEAEVKRRDDPIDDILKVFDGLKH